MSAVVVPTESTLPVAADTVAWGGVVPGASGAAERSDSMESSCGVDRPPAQIGEFPIVLELGRGGAGVVYLAWEPMMERHVALKVIHAFGSGQQQLYGDLLAEAQVAGQLCHTGIAPVYRIGFDEELGPFYTMRFVEGRDLAQIVRGRREHDPEVSEEFPRTHLLRLFLDACRAVGYAHSVGILHRDLKPSNLIATPHGEMLVIDWGLACRADRAYLARTAGTFGYLAPELLVEPAIATPASDVFALGAILFEILTLQPALPANSMGEALSRARQLHFAPPDTTAVWAPLAGLVRRCLAAVPQERFADANVLAHELQQILDGRHALTSVVDFDGGVSAAGESDAQLPAGLALLGSALASTGGLGLGAGAVLRLEEPVSGGWHLECEFEVSWDLLPWELRFVVSLDNEPDQPYLELVIGRQDRVRAHLLRRGVLIGRSLEPGLQPGQRCRVTFIGESSRIAVLIGDRPVIDATEPFAPTRIHLALQVAEHSIVLHRFSVAARGAPLQLSYLMLPDRLVHRRRYAEARELYLELHHAHPEHQEGHAALYKAAWCATELGDLAQAVQEFCQLEAGPFDHGCALGLARVGVVTGNIDWGGTALMDSYLRHRDPRIRRELWFALLNLIEHLPVSAELERVDRAFCALRDAEPDPDDAATLTVMLLDGCLARQGRRAMRDLALRLLQEFPGQREITEQALLGLHYAGLDEVALSSVENALGPLLTHVRHRGHRLRLLLMSADIAMFHENHEEARRVLEEARTLVPAPHPDHVWTLGWTAVQRWLADEPAAILEIAAPRTLGLDVRTVSQAAHLELLRCLAHTRLGDLQAASEGLGHLASGEPLWCRAAASMLDDPTGARFLDEAPRYPDRLLSEAAFYLGEFRRCTGEHHSSREWYARILGQWSERALFRRVSRDRLAMPA